MKWMVLKLNILILVFVFSITIFSLPTLAAWGKTDKGGVYWDNGDGTFVQDAWKLIDEDGDGKGYYYFFNENGFLQLDDITPDYKIVDKEGRRLDYDGEPEIGIVEIYVEEGEAAEYSEDFFNEIKDNVVTYIASQGLTSSGAMIVDKQGGEDEGPRPSDGLVLDVNLDGTAKVLLGPGVTLRDKNESKYDTTIDKEMVNYVKSSDKFSKKVNGTTFTKNKWKEVMALKGSGATVVFENPKNNFNKLKGRIATHYFTYSDRTTQCTLYIINNDNNDEIYSTSNFNYNSGCRFECTFYQSVSSIRFELEVIGQYTSRVCYLRDCEFSFDRETWEDEQYDKEVEEEYIRKYGTESEADMEGIFEGDEESDEYDDGLGEKAEEGESPYDRYRRINGLATMSDLPLEYAEDDDSITEEMKASISELRRKMELEDEERNKVSGPAFDKRLKDIKNERVKSGPADFESILEGHLDEESSE